jgi:hypothetical protein
VHTAYVKVKGLGKERSAYIRVVNRKPRKENSEERRIRRIQLAAHDIIIIIGQYIVHHITYQ